MKTQTKSLFVIIFVFTLLLTGEQISNAQAQAGATLTLSPSNYLASQVDETFNLNITITNVNDLNAWTMDVSWDPKILQLEGDPVEGEFLTNVASTVFLFYTQQVNIGALNIGSAFLSRSGASGSGTLAKLTFKIVAAAAYSPIRLENVSIYSSESGSTFGTRKPLAHNEPQPAATVSLLTGEGPLAHAGEPQTVNEGSPVQFNASRTIPITDGTQFRWTFEDNGTKELSGIMPTYTFERPAIYDVRLTVTDEQGLNSSTTVRITVKDITPPVAIITLRDIAPGAQIPVGQAVTFDALKSYDPEYNETRNVSGLNATGYTWDLGDGSALTSEEAHSDIIHHTYNKAGSYTVSLSVTDIRANLIGTTTMQVTVGEVSVPQTLNLPPTVIWILVGITVIVIAGSALWLTGTTIIKPLFKKQYEEKAGTNKKA